MGVMATALSGLPRSRPLNRDDLDAIRDAVDDGHRYELIDGVLVVSPSPRHAHQRAVGNLYLVLRAACPDHLEVLLAPFDVALAGDTVMQPDLLVARRDEIAERDLPGPPVLAIEVLSPSTRSFDLHTKKNRLLRAGCEHYWVVDPLVPSITAWRLVVTGQDPSHDPSYDPGYDLVGMAVGRDVLQVSEPVVAAIAPLALVER